LLTKDADYQWARPALVANKIRAMQLQAGQSARKGNKRGAAYAYNIKELRNREIDVERHAERAYRQFVSRRQPIGTLATDAHIALGNVDVEVADGIGFELLLRRLVALRLHFERIRHALYVAVVSRKVVRQVRRLRSSTRRPPRALKKGAGLDPSGYDAGKKIKDRKQHILVNTLGLLLSVVASRPMFRTVMELFLSCAGRDDCSENGDQSKHGFD
jgi:hypothetical protein